MSPQDLLNYPAAPELLKDRVILITGAGSGLGAALAKRCAQLGATVVLLDKSMKPLEAVYDAIEAAGGPQPAIYPMNLEGATAKDYEDLRDNLEAEFGRLDGLVNNAAWVGALTPIEHYDLELWAKVITINLHAPFLLSHALLPLLLKAPDPSIVFSTQACSKAYWGAFGAAKAGQHALMDILAHEHGGKRWIRVNGIDTGPMRTPLRVSHYPGEDPAQNPEPEAMVGPYVYFLGPDAGKTTGQNIELQPSS